MASNSFFTFFIVDRRFKVGYSLFGDMNAFARVEMSSLHPSKFIAKFTILELLSLDEGNLNEVSRESA